MYELVSPVNPWAVLKYLSQLLVGIGLVLCVPLAVAVHFTEYEVAAVYASLAITILLFGYGLHRMLPDVELQWKEALVIAALIFPLSALISAVPFAFSTGMPPIDALFEAVSGVTTTGLSVAPPDVGPVFLFARSWLQWIGGIGIVLVVLSVLIHPGTSAYRLYSVHIAEEKLRPNVMATAWLLGKIYIGITVIAFILLLHGGMQPFDAVCHALSTVSTGGFSTRTDSIAAFPGFLIQVTVVFCSCLGAVNFALYSKLFRRPKTLLESEQLRMLIAIAVIAVIILVITLYINGFGSEALSISFFQAISALTTAGFSTVDISTLPESSKAVLSVLMWIGGSVGSTAGGIKILRLIILFKIIHLVFIRYFLPREALTPLKVRGEVIENDEVYTILSFVLLYATILVASAFIFMMNGYGSGDSVFEVSSALGTVGLSTGITQMAMPGHLKLVLIFDMLLGRIEIIPLFILFFPKTWFKHPLLLFKKEKAG